MENKCIILLINDISNNTHIINHLKKVEDKCIIWETKLYDAPENEKKSYDHKMSHTKRIETHTVLSELKKIHKKYEYNDVLIIKSSTIVNMSIRKVFKKLNYVKNNITFDLFYLCKWNDNCNKYSNIGVGDSIITNDYAYTFEPSGIQVLFINNDFIKKMLGYVPVNNNNNNNKNNNNIYFSQHKSLTKTIKEHLLKNNIYAITTYSTPFNYDIRHAQYDGDMKKIKIMKDKPDIRSTKNKNIYYLWIAIFFILLLLFAWIIIPSKSEVK